MKAIRIFPLFIFLLLQIACSNQEKHSQTISEEIVKTSSKPINEMESTCRFAKAEFQKYYLRTKKKPEFENTKYLNLISSMISHLDKNCDLELVKNDFLTYLKSPEFKEESKNLEIADNFADKKTQLIEGAKNKYEAIKEVAISITQLSFHTEDAKMGLYSRSAIQRLAEVNGDTIELRKNINYTFPTSYYINERLLYLGKMEYEPIILNGGHQLDSIRKVKIKADAKKGVMATSTDNSIFVKTVQ